MYKSFLIKYAEIAIKGKNRYLFEDALVQNIRYHLERVEGTFHVRKETDVSMWIRKENTIMMKL